MKNRTTQDSVGILLLLSLVCGLFYGIPLASHTISQPFFQTIHLPDISYDGLWLLLDQLALLLWADLFLWLCGASLWIGGLSVLISFGNGIALGMLLRMSSFVAKTTVTLWFLYWLLLFTQAAITLCVLVTCNRCSHLLRIGKKPSEIYKGIGFAHYLHCFQARVLSYCIFLLLIYFTTHF